MKTFILGFVIGLIAIACAGGSKSFKVDFDHFPKRVDEESIFTECKDKREGFVCKVICEEYNRANECKKGKEEKEVVRSTYAMIKSGYVIVSRSFLINLLRWSM